MRKKLEIYRNAINKALIAVGEEHGLELKCGSAEYSDYDFTFKLKGVVKTNTVDGRQELFKQQAQLFGFDVDDYGKEFVENGKRYRFIGFNERAKKNHCKILCLNDDKIYTCNSAWLKSMIRKAQPDMGKTPGQKTAGQERVPSRKEVTYYVAECMEFPNLGEYHENLTVDQAVELYKNIPADRRNAIKGIGIIVHTKGQPDYTDAHFEIMHLSKLSPDNLEYAGEDKPLVLDAYLELLDCLKRKGIEYSINPDGR
ncbi:hypothetical protein QMP26_41625 (plasmid) [Enterocloster clostridioformis]